MQRYIPVTEEEAQEQKKGGNIGLPFGLCAKYGILLPQGATPRDAWDALEKKIGLSPDKIYQNIKKNGSLVFAPKEKNVERKAIGLNDIKTKDDFVDFIRNQFNISLENDKNHIFNQRRKLLYTKIPAHDNVLLSFLKKKGFHIDEHMNGYYWIDITSGNRN